MNEARQPVSLYTGPSGPWGRCLTPVLSWPVEANKSLIMDSPVIILYQYYNLKYQFCDCNAIYYIYFSTLSKGLKGKYLAQALTKRPCVKYCLVQLNLTHSLSVLQKDGVSPSSFLLSHGCRAFSGSACFIVDAHHAGILRSIFQQKCTWAVWNI